MILYVAKEAVLRQIPRRPPVKTLSVLREDAIVDESLLDGLGQLSEGAEVGVISLRRSVIENGKKRMVEVIAPLRVDPEPAGFAWGNDARIVRITLRDQHLAPAQRCLQQTGLRRELLQKMNRRAIDVCVDRIQPQAVDVKITHPHQSVVTEESADLVGPRALQVHGPAPRRVVRVCYVGSEVAGVIARRAEVVVHNIEQDDETLPVCSVHKTLERVGPAIRLMHGEECDAVISPAVIAGEGRDGHQFHMRDSHANQVIQFCNSRIERAFGSPCADVQLINHGTGERRGLKRCIGPCKRPLIVHARQPMHTVWLR